MAKRVGVKKESSGHWMQGAVKHPGALTKQANAAGKSVSEFMASPGPHPSATTKKRIALAKTFKKVRKGG